MYMLNIRSKYLEAQIIQSAKKIHKLISFPCNTEFFSSVYKSGCNLFLDYKGEPFLEIYGLDKDRPRVDIHFNFSHLLPDVLGEMLVVIRELEANSLSCKVYTL